MPPPPPIDCARMPLESSPWVVRIASVLPTVTVLALPPAPASPPTATSPPATSELPPPAPTDCASMALAPTQAALRPEPVLQVVMLLPLVTETVPPSPPAEPPPPRATRPIDTPALPPPPPIDWARMPWA